MQQNTWLSEKEVAQLTGISVSTLQKNRFYRRGIPYSKVGRLVRYVLKDVEAYLSAHQVPVEG